MRKTRGTGVYLYEICESPGIIDAPQFAEAADEIIESIRIQLKNNKCEKVKEYRTDFTLYKAGDKFLNARNDRYQDCYFLLDKTSGDIAYFTLYEFLEIPKVGKCFTQSAVYQVPDYANELKGAARDLMLNQYIYITGYLVSDDRQTRNGKEFWKKLMLDAFSKNYSVYIYHPDRGPRELEKSEMQYFEEWYTEPVDGSYRIPGPLDIRFIISK